MGSFQTLQCKRILDSFALLGIQQSCEYPTDIQKCVRMCFTFLHWHSCEAEYGCLGYLQSVWLWCKFSCAACATQPKLKSCTILDLKGPVLIYVQDLVAKVT